MQKVKCGYCGKKFDGMCGEEYCDEECFRQAELIRQGEFDQQAKEWGRQIVADSRKAFEPFPPFVSTAPISLGAKDIEIANLARSLAGEIDYRNSLQEDITRLMQSLEEEVDYLKDKLAIANSWLEKSESKVASLKQEMARLMHLCGY